MGRAEERRRSARNHTGAVDAIWETGETLMETEEKKSRQERIGSVAANPGNIENRKEAGGGPQDTQGSRKNCTSRESVPRLSRLIRRVRNKYH